MKLIKRGIFFIIFGVLIWYFFVKEYDYQINFNAKTTVGTLNQSIKSWNSSLQNFQPINQINEGELLQTIKQNDTIFTYLWKIKQTSDSTVKVSAFVKEGSNKFKNRLLIPFTEPSVEREAKKSVRAFVNNLQNHLNEINITIEGIENSPQSYAAYVEVNTIQIEKAKGMMANFGLLSSFISDNNLEANGQPFLEVTSWNRENDSISYHFCFPFKKNDTITGNDLISIKEFHSKKSIKAIYNGNYITSDRTWYALEQYALKNSINVDLLPIEVFHNNPNMGGDESQWKTEVYLPLKEE